MKPFAIVAVQSFIEATRDTGYKSTGSAIAELVDNALEASAKRVDVTIEHAVNAAATHDSIIRVTDDGTGMTPAVMRLALQFGGSTRFGSRVATGRYGMGLPNGGLSQARRLEVFTWTNSSRVWSSYLDVDEIAANSMRAVPTPRIAQGSTRPRTRSGTIVVLSKCDRLDCDDTQILQLKLLAEFGASSARPSATVGRSRSTGFKSGRLIRSFSHQMVAFRARSFMAPRSSTDFGYQPLLSRARRSPSFPSGFPNYLFKSGAISQMRRKTISASPKMQACRSSGRAEKSTMAGISWARSAKKTTMTGGDAKWPSLPNWMNSLG